MYDAYLLVNLKHCQTMLLVNPALFSVQNHVANVADSIICPKLKINNNTQMQAVVFTTEKNLMYGGRVSSGNISVFKCNSTVIPKKAVNTHKVLHISKNKTIIGKDKTTLKKVFMYFLLNMIVLGIIPNVLAKLFPDRIRQIKPPIYY